MSGAEEVAGDVEAQEQDDTQDEYQASKRSKFRFKSKRKRRDVDGDLSDEVSAGAHRGKRHHSSDSKAHRHHRHHSGHHRGSKRHNAPPPTPRDDPALYDDTHLPNARTEAYTSPDAAFQESVFDALADDEGAAYWEGVYGQPIHTYPSTRPGPDGELERMTDEEYTAHVRARMWEKSHQHVIEERERREERRRERERVRKESARMGRERDIFERELQGSLRRGEERKMKARWKDRWTEYLDGWERLKKERDVSQGTDPSAQRKKIRDRIPWPTESGRMVDLGVEEVEQFFRNAQAGRREDDALDLLGVLKVERVRWHPDKMQHRLGSQGLDPAIIKAVTGIFQVVDRLWAEERDKKS